MAAEGALAAFHDAHARRGRDRAGDLCAWLQAERPAVLLTGPGGGVVWDSDPWAEVEESWVKVRPLLEAIGAPATAIDARLEPGIGA